MIAWFICPYKRQIPPIRPPTRYCAMQDFSDQINADGGEWSETEVLGNCALVKVRASAATLTETNQAPEFMRFPKTALSDTLSDLTAGQRQAMKDKLLEMGYPLAEIREALGDDLMDVTLGDVLRFAARRRREGRYDHMSGNIVFDGRIHRPRLVASVEAGVQ